MEAKYIIRLRRTFKVNNFKYYNIVVALKKKNVQSGLVVEKIGFFSPFFNIQKGKFLNRKIFFLNLDRFAYWLSFGTEISDKVLSLFVKFYSFYKKN